MDNKKLWKDTAHYAVTSAYQSVLDECNKMSGTEDIKEAFELYTCLIDSNNLEERHKKVRENKNIIISVYTNAVGFLWNLSKVKGGTDLGYSDDIDEDEKLVINEGTFKTYEDALKNALDLIDKCDLEQFKKETPVKFHWGNYANHLLIKYQ